MSSKFFTPEGKPIEIAQLNVLKARFLALALAQEKIEFATLVQCLTHQDGETVIFDVKVEVPQLTVHDIKNQERIAAVFYKADNHIPEVLALRTDFPRVPHRNLRDKEFPRSLCLYDEEYRNLKRSWTAQRFVERIRQWLALTAKGELHQDDQPLEPLISGYVGIIVLPRIILQRKETCPERLYLSGRGSSKDIDMLFLVAERERPSNNHTLPSIASIHVCNPQQHGVIHRKPHTLRDIALFAEKGGIDLLSELRDRLRNWWKENSKEYNFFENPLILILACPKTREKDTETEAIDVWAFISGESFKEVGKKIGLWEERDIHIVPLIPIDYSGNGDDVKVELLNTAFQLTRESAAYLNGLEEVSDMNIVAVGVGALGSQVIMNLARSGTGTWKLIDDDILMPHNVTRHALSSSAIGFKKSTAMAFSANDFIHDIKLFTAIPADVLEPKKYEEEVKQALENADVILDMSASITVARYLGIDNSSPVKRISLFLNPTGNDLVLLAEDKQRSTRLDEIEMQLYRAIIDQDDLKEHFKISDGRRRYGRSCRDITTVLTQDVVAMHAAIGSRALQQVLQDASPYITVWKSDDKGNVKRIDVTVYPTIRHEIGDWTIVLDTYTIDRLPQLRHEKLPNETGGVLIGSFDLERKIIYIVDVIPSPPDSEEWPTLYIRGSKGLKDKIEEITLETFDMLGYVGEWHTHPDRISTAPSDDDLKVFTWLTEWMDRDGLPAVMMIIGDNNRSSCFVGEISQAENLIPDLTNNMKI